MARTRRASTAPDTPDMMTPGQVAAVFGVDSKTVTRWAQKGRIECVWTLGGHRRYNRQYIMRLASRPSADSPTL